MADVRINDAALAELLSGPEGPVARELSRRGALVETAMVEGIPVDSGITRGEIGTQQGFDADGAFVRVGLPDEHPAVDLEYGTGIYGREGRPITPKKGKALRFVVEGEVVFARSVKGQKAQPFMRRALDEGMSAP